MHTRLRTVPAFLRTVLVALFLLAFIFLVGPIFILHCVLTGSADRLYRVSVGAASLALRMAGVRVRAEGLENLPAGVCLFISNHASNVDPPAVVGAIPRRVALLAKESVFRFPVFGTALRLGRFIPVDRNDRSSALASVELAKRSMREGMSYLVFAEGTRSRDGRLMPFKKGSFVLAIETGAPVVPVSVMGSHHVMPRKALLIRPGEILVRFHPPVSSSGYGLDQRDLLMERVHAIVASGLPPEQLPHCPPAEHGTARA